MMNLRILLSDGVVVDSMLVAVFSGLMLSAKRVSLLPVGRLTV